MFSMLFTCIGELLGDTYLIYIILSLEAAHLGDLMRI